MHISPMIRAAALTRSQAASQTSALQKGDQKLGQTTQKGYTLIPLRLYFGGKVK